MRVKLILPSLTECDSPHFRPVKYSLFPPLGLATIAAFFGPDDEVELVDEHVVPLRIDDAPDLVGIEVYITFFEGGRSFYTQRVDEALAEIERLPGRHLYFLDDHLLGDRRFAEGLFSGMMGMNRLFQGASTVDAVLRGDTIERAAAAGLRSLFLGFETLDPAALAGSNKLHNVGRDYDRAIRRLDDLGVLVNGSFVFGLDGDGPDVFDRTVEWAVTRGLTTATFHVATPYPRTAFFAQIVREGRLITRNWDRYDTRQAVFTPRGMDVKTLEAGYWRAYQDFYAWRNIRRAASALGAIDRSIKHLAYSGAWKKLEPVWDAVIRSRRLGSMRPMLEAVLTTVPRLEPAA